MNLYQHKPTVLTFRQLYTWVIWQFPQVKNNHLCGAVRPPIADHGWYAALIDTNRQVVHLFAHIDQLFDSPEEAAAYLNTNHLPLPPHKTNRDDIQSS